MLRKIVENLEKITTKKAPALMEWGPLFMGVGGGVLLPGDDVVVYPDHVG